jgi:hypothetical protein
MTVRSGGASKRTLAVLASCAVAVVGIVAALALVGFGGGKSGGGTVAATDATAPLTVAKPPLIRDGGLILNEPDSADQDWLTSGISPLPGAHRYQVTVTNASSIGFIDSFEWYPPTGVRILKVIGSSAGHCVLTGLSGFGGDQFKAVLLYPNIFCDAVALKPPTCTCTGDGGSMTISFVLSTEATASGAARVVTATPTLKTIPSFITSS